MSGTVHPATFMSEPNISHQWLGHWMCTSCENWSPYAYYRQNLVVQSKSKCGYGGKNQTLQTTLTTPLTLNEPLTRTSVNQTLAHNLTPSW